MKKNRTMRAAVIMLALALITSCFVGGTFAKYITTGEATDSARVAKWGVTVEAFDGSSFKTEYKHCQSLASLNVSSFDTSKVTTMVEMFRNCYPLTSLDVSSFDTSNVTSMMYMFTDCRSLTSLDVTSFDTSKVTNMAGMFYNCRYLTSLDLTGFDTSKVTNMSGMFYNCSYLTSLDLTGFDTSKVTDMSTMFASNDDLKTIYVSNLWSNEAVTTGDRMFEGSTVLQGGAGTKYNSSYTDHTYARVDYAATPGYLTLKSEAAPAGNFTLKAGSSFRDAVSPLITNFGATKLQFGSWAEYGLVNGFSWQEGLDVSAAGDGSIRAFHGDTVYILSGGSMSANADAKYMFDAMSALTAIGGFENVDMSKVTDMGCMFRNCSGLQSLDLSSFDVSSVTSMNYMFEGLKSLTNLELSMKNASKVTTMYAMFQGSTGLQSVKFIGLNTTALENMGSMFNGCSALTSVDLSGLDTGNVTSMGNLFTGCSSLTSVDLSVLDTGKVVYMDHLFKNCTNLTSITFPDETGALADINYMFEGCKAIKTIDLSSFDTSNVTNMTGMFYSSGLTGFDFKTLKTSSVTTMSRMFDSCTSLTSVTSGFSAPNLTTMSYMFTSSNVQNVSLTGLQASKLTDMSRMFYSCVGSSLTVDFTNSVTSVNDMSYMCFGSKLTSFTIKGLDTSKVTTMQAMFMQSRSLHTIDISSCNTANVTNMTQMFASCDALEYIYGGTTNWNTGKVSSSDMMFGACFKLFSTYGNKYVYDVSVATYYVKLK